jgi:hypothetical protein
MEKKNTRGNSKPAFGKASADKPNVFLPATADLRRVEDTKRPEQASAFAKASADKPVSKPAAAPAPAGLGAGPQTAKPVPAPAAMASLRPSKPAFAPAAAGGGKPKQAEPTHEQISARAKAIWQAGGSSRGRS